MQSLERKQTTARLVHFLEHVEKFPQEIKHSWQEATCNDSLVVQAFIQAWRATCDFNGKAMLLIPPGNYILGETIFQGPCQGPAPVIVRLEGTLLALNDLSAYPEKGWISFDEINGLLLTGRGTIDGQGQNMWKYNDCNENPSCSKLPAVSS